MKQQKGLTIIELMIVVAIIGIMVAVLYDNSQNKENQVQQTSQK